MKKRNIRNQLLEIEKEREKHKETVGGDLEIEQNKPVMYLLIAIVILVMLTIGLVWTMDIIQTQQAKIKKVTKKDNRPKCNQLGYSEGFSWIKPVNPMDTKVTGKGALKTKIINTNQKTINITEIKWELIKPMHGVTTNVGARITGKELQKIKKQHIQIGPEEIIRIQTMNTVNQTLSPQLFKGILSISYTYASEKKKKIHEIEQGVLHGCIS